MSLGSFDKQPREILDYDLDYTDWLPDGDSVESAAVLIDPSDSTLEVISVFINSPRVKIWVRLGTDRITYNLTVLMTSHEGRLKESEFKIKVRDTS